MKRLLFVLLCLAGCTSAPQRPTTNLQTPTFSVKTLPPSSVDTKQIFKVEGFTLVLKEKEHIRKMVEERLGITNAMGFFDGATRTLYVPFSGDCDRFNREMPDLETLGHEVWHIPELGGMWHTNPPVNLPGWSKSK